MLSAAAVAGVASMAFFSACVAQGASEEVASVESAVADAAEGTLTEIDAVLDPVQVMCLTVEHSPYIKRSFERKAAEEARYDFFIANREGLSYGVGAAFDYNRLNTAADKSVEKYLYPEVFVRKDFYNTSATSLSTGYSLSDYQDSHDGDAFVRARVSVPLFGSREALERSNAKIFQQNEVSDARLNYYREIRHSIRSALDTFGRVQRDKEQLGFIREYRVDLEELLKVAESLSERDTSSDKVKLKARIASTIAEENSMLSRFEVSVERLKLIIGIPFDMPVKIGNGNFNPFEAESQAELEAISLETDEEIKTLLNSIRASQAELALARTGKWDTSLEMSATRYFAGDGGLEEQRGYNFFSGVEVRRIDSRISRSLENIALANIREYTNAIESRKREIHADTVDAYLGLASQTEEVRARETNLSGYWENYRKGVEQYGAGLITIDELIQKRNAIREEQQEISWARQNSRENVANLLASTGRYEQFIEDELGGTEETAPEGF